MPIETVKIRTRSNIEEVFRDLDAFVSSAEDIALPRALNVMRDQAQVAGLREISRVYRIGPRIMEQYVSVSIASANEPEASITVKGKAFPLSDFKPVQTKAGVVVTLKGRRHLIPHAFMVKRFGKHVYARGAYGGKGKGFRSTGSSFGRFRFGKGRLPINEIYTMSPSEAFANPDVVDAMMDRIEEQAPLIVEREIAAVRRGF